MVLLNLHVAAVGSNRLGAKATRCSLTSHPVVRLLDQAQTQYTLVTAVELLW
jgi:hypothetical protein